MSKLRRVGQQKGAGAYPLLKRMPVSAKRSTFGVRKKSLRVRVSSGFIFSDVPTQL
jgi:hypothetical protein